MKVTKNREKKNKKRTKSNNFKTQFTEKRLSSKGGLALIKKLWDKLGGENELEQGISIEKGANATYPISRVLTILVLGIVGGAKHISHLYQLSVDDALRSLWNWVKFPVVSTITRTLELFNHRHCYELTSVHQRLRQKVWKNKYRLQKVTLDLDSSPKTVYGNQEGVGKGYNPEHPGKKSYHPLFCFVSETLEILHGWLRDGTAYTANGAAEFFKECFSFLPNMVRWVTVRADAGFFGKEFLDLLEQFKCKYIIACKIKGWKVLAETKANWRKRGANLWTGIFYHQCQGWDKPRKFVAVKELLGYDYSPNFFGPQPIYDYYLCVTNIDNSVLTLWRFYNKRANCENLIAQGKNQIGMGSMRTQLFWSNAVLFELALLAYNLIVWFRRTCFPMTRWNEEVETFRSWFLYTAAKVVHTGRKWYLNLSEGLPWKREWQQTLSILEQLVYTE